MNVKYDIKWQERIKDCIEDIIFNKRNILFYEDNKTKADLDEFYSILYDDSLFTEFISAYKSEFCDNAITQKLEKLSKEIITAYESVKTNNELIENKNWHEAQRLVVSLLYDDNF